MRVSASSRAVRSCRVFEDRKFAAIAVSSRGRVSRIIADMWLNIGVRVIVSRASVIKGVTKWLSNYSGITVVVLVAILFEETTMLTRSQTPDSAQGRRSPLRTNGIPAKIYLTPSNGRHNFFSFLFANLRTALPFEPFYIINTLIERRALSFPSQTTILNPVISNLTDRYFTDSVCAGGVSLNSDLLQSCQDRDARYEELKIFFPAQQE